MTILLFILLLVVSFLVLLYFLRPTATETAVQQHLESIEENRAIESDSTSILRRQVLSATPWLDEEGKVLANCSNFRQQWQLRPRGRLRLDGCGAAGRFRQPVRRVGV